MALSQRYTFTEFRTNWSMAKKCISHLYFEFDFWAADPEVLIINSLAVMVVKGERFGKWGAMVGILLKSF